MKNFLSALILFNIITFSTQAQLLFTPNAAVGTSSTGNVGIGTSSPAHKLDVFTGAGNFKTYHYGTEYTINTTGGWARSFRFRNEYDDKTVALGAISGSFFISTGQDITTDPVGHLNQKFVVSGSGKVGIGTTSPGHLLHLKSSIPYMRFELDDNSYSMIEWLEETTRHAGIAWSGHRNPKRLDFFTLNGSGFKERMSIEADGNVGIGTTTPDEKLAVNGNIHTKEVRVDLTGWSDFRN